MHINWIKSLQLLEFNLTGLSVVFYGTSWDNVNAASTAQAPAIFTTFPLHPSQSPTTMDRRGRDLPIKPLFDFIGRLLVDMEAALGMGGLPIMVDNRKAVNSVDNLFRPQNSLEILIPTT